ncbi:MAG: immune inhibitor A domain-containing protein [candidate division WOR-3 bacterium]
MTKRVFPILLLIGLLMNMPGLARELRLTKPGRRPLPQNALTRKRLIQAVTHMQSAQAPFQRFRFRPTERDISRIERLRNGGVDTVRVLVLRVEFQEDTTSLTTGNGKMDTFGFFPPDSGLFVDPPHFKRYFERQMEGLRNYFRAMSLGKLYVDFTVMPQAEKECYQLPREMMFYGDTLSMEGIEFGLVRLMRDAFKVADEDPAIDFSRFDEFIIFHAGSGLQSDLATDNRWDSPFDLLAGEIPPGAIEAYLGEPYISVDSGRVRIEQATVLPEMMRQDTLTEGGITNLAGMVGLAGTLCHEFAHLLGAYDLYDVTGVTMGVGAWSLMGYGGWLGDYSAGAPPGVIPGFLDAYHRVALGFVNPLVVQMPRESILVFASAMDTGLFNLRNSPETPTIVKIPINDHEYFLIENRQCDVRKPDTIVVDMEDSVLISVEDNEYDFFQPGSGILIWHIDEQVIAEYGPYNAINIDAGHKGVDLEEADGIQDYDVPYWRMSDYYYEIYGYRFDAFSRQGLNDAFTGYTSPNSDGYTGKTLLSVTLLGIKDTTDRLKDTVIPITINWEFYQKGFPKRVGETPLLSPFVADIDGDDSLEIAVMDTAGHIQIWRPDGRLFRSLGIGSPTKADLALGDVSGDAKLEIVASGTDGKVRVIPLSGLPVVLATCDRIVAAPVLGDLDGDGKKEIIVGSTDMKLYAWKGDGRLMPGFPVNIGTEIWAPVALTDSIRPQIVVLTADSRLYLLNPDGTLVYGFPITLGVSSFYAQAQPVVADFDRDSVMEIAVVAGGGHDYRLYVVEQDGTISFQSQELVQHPFLGTIAVADVDRDGYLDIVAAARHKLFAFNRNGTLVTNYPFAHESTFTKTELAGNWIITYDAPFEFRSSPVIADINGDNQLDLVIGSPVFGLLGYDGLSGKELQFFPLMATGSVSAVPLVGDIDKDGILELAAGTDNGMLYVWKLSGSVLPTPWPCAYHDVRHTGLVPLSELPPWPQLPAPESKLVDNFFLYPNPAAEQVNVRYWLGPNASSAKILVLDMAGEPVTGEITGRTLPRADNETTVDLTKLAPGLYVVRLTVEAGSSKAVRFAKLAVIR